MIISGIIFRNIGRIVSSRKKDKPSGSDPTLFIKTSRGKAEKIFFSAYVILSNFTLTYYVELFTVRNKLLFLTLSERIKINAKVKTY